MVEGVVVAVAQGDRVAAVGFVDGVSEMVGGQGALVSGLFVNHFGFDQLGKMLERCYRVVFFHFVMGITINSEKYFCVFLYLLIKCVSLQIAVLCGKCM